MSEKKPLLALVRDELVGMDRDNVVDLVHYKACRELVDLTAHRQATFLLHQPGTILADDDFDRLAVFLRSAGVQLTRVPNTLTSPVVS